MRIDRVDGIPQLLLDNLCAYGALEYERAKGEYADFIQRESRAIWYGSDEDRPLFALGLLQQSLLGLPHLWFMLGKSVRPIDLRFARMVMPPVHAVAGAVRTLVAEDFETGVRFAKFCGFRPMDDTVSAWGKTYTTYEARQCRS